MTVNIAICQGTNRTHYTVPLLLDASSSDIPGMRIALVALNMPPLTFLDRKFISDGTKVALLPDDIDSRTFPKCPTKAGALSFNSTSCSLDADPCSCRIASEQAACECKRFLPLSFLNDTKALLPKRIANTVVKPNNMSAFVETSLNNIELQISIDGFTIQSMSDNSICHFRPGLLSGWTESVEFKYTCTAAPGEALAHIHCPSLNFTAHCDASAALKTAYLTLPAGKIDENCELICPNSKQPFNLVGQIH